jgi:hypothetical protein
MRIESASCDREGPYAEAQDALVGALARHGPGSRVLAPPYASELPPATNHASRGEN